MAQSFDVKRFALTGRPVAVVDQVRIFRTSAFFSASERVLTYRAGSERGRIEWFDRQGKAQGAVGDPAVYRAISLSPDGVRAAVSRRVDEQSPAFSIWLLDFARGGAGHQHTFGSGFHDAPVWSPDGSRIVYSAVRDGVYGLFQKAANGAGDEEPVLPPGTPRFPNDWSRDGRFILYSELGPKAKGDLWVLPATGGSSGERKPTPYLVAEFNESQGQFSPDVHWVVYTSDESGIQEIWVRPFPLNSGPGGKWLVSKGGGSQPRWRNSREIVYLAPDRKLMAVEVTTSPTFQPGVPKPLFTSPIFLATGDLQRYDVTADGKRFLINSEAVDPAASPITVVLNWTAALGK
jgi:Tol biopolymer transport system component